MTPPDDPSFWKTAFEWAWAVVATLGGLVWKSQNEKIEGQAKEIDRQRDNISKLFDKLETHGQRSEDRHHELLKAIHQGLSGKADK